MKLCDFFGISKRTTTKMVLNIDLKTSYVMSEI
jgi:hypothetical protein